MYKTIFRSQSETSDIFGFFISVDKHHLRELEICHAAKEAGTDEALRDACFEVARSRLTHHLEPEGVEFVKEEIPSWRRTLEDVLENKDVKLFVSRYSKKLVHRVWIVMNVDSKDPNFKRITEATIKHVFDRKLAPMRKMDRVENGCKWEYWEGMAHTPARNVLGR